MAEKADELLVDLELRDVLSRLTEAGGVSGGCAASIAGSVAAALAVAGGGTDVLRERLAALTASIDASRTAAERLASLGEGERVPVDAALAPVQTISESLQVLEAVDGLLRQADPSRIADLGAALALAHASIMAAYLTARTNIERVAEETIRAKARTLIDEALVRSSDRVRETMAWVLQQMESAGGEGH